MKLTLRNSTQEYIFEGTIEEYTALTILEQKPSVVNSSTVNINWENLPLELTRSIIECIYKDKLPGCVLDK